MWTWFIFQAAAGELAPEVQQAEALADAGDLPGLVRTLEAYTAAHPDDCEGLWRLSRAYYEQGEVLAQSESDARRIPIYEKAEALADRCIAVDPQDGQGYLWKGAALARIGTARGVLASLRSAGEIETLWLRSLQTPTRYRLASGISSFPGDVYYGLGIFYRMVPDWRVVEWVAGTRGDLDASIRYLRLLVADEPNRIEGMKELGVSLLCQGQKKGDTGEEAEGRIWLQKALATPGTYPTDVIDHRQIPVILAHEGDVCGYSRDGWEDLTEQAYARQK